MKPSEITCDICAEVVTRHGPWNSIENGDKKYNEMVAVISWIQGAKKGELEQLNFDNAVESTMNSTSIKLGAWS